MTNPSKIADIERKLIDLDVPTLAYYADYFLKKMGDVWSVPMGGTMMSIELEEDHHLNILDYYRDMYHVCSLELLRRRESIFGLEPVFVGYAK